MSISTRILLVVAALGAALSTLLGLYAASAWTDRASSAEQQQFSHMSLQLINASAALAVERGLVNGQLAAPAAIPADMKARILAARGMQTASLQAAGLSLADRTSITAGLGVLDQIRTQFDEAASGRGLAPSSTVWFASATAGIDALVALRRQIDTRGSTRTQSQILVALRDRLAELAEFAGRERGMLNGLIASGAKATTSQIHALGSLAGRVDSVWAVIGADVETASPQLRASVDAARHGWDVGLLALRQSVLQSAIRQDPWPISATVWFKEATVAIELVLAAQSVASDDIDRVLMQEQTRLTRILWGSAAALAVALALSIGISFYVRRSVLRPLTRLIGLLSQLADGNLDVFIPAAPGRDEIARLTEATIKFQETARQAEGMAQAQTELRYAAETSRREALRDIGDMIGEVSDEAVSGVCVLTEHLQRVAADLYGGAGAMAHDSRQVADDADIARQNSASATGSARELTLAISEIAQQMERAARSTREAVGRTRDTEQVFAALSGHVQEVGEVARLIAEIAGRTNLLALNATIEAARAGDAGRGFAVVASEVKLLAQETERSTVRIAQRISAIEASTRDAIVAVGGISASINEIDGVAAMVAAAVEQQAASTSGIADAVSQVSRAAERVASRMEAMSAGTTACETGAGKLAEITRDVAGQVTGIKASLVGIMCQRVAALDRRSEQRVGVRVRGSVQYGGVSVPGLVADISVIGVRFVADIASSMVADNRVQLHLPDLPAFEARVVRTDKLLVQLDFRDNTEPSRLQLQAWIDRQAVMSKAA